MGGGRRSFLPCGSVDSEGDTISKGCRSDGRNLTNEWLNKYNNSEYVWNKDQLKNIDPNKTDDLLGKIVLCLFSISQFFFFSALIFRQSIRQPVVLSVGSSVARGLSIRSLCRQSACRSVCRSVSQSVRQTVGPTVCQSLVYAVGPSVTVHQAVGLCSVRLAVGPSVRQSIRVQFN